MREGAQDKAGIRARIGALGKPLADPIGGKDGPISDLWAV
jgi:uncharacterized protein YjlB